MQNRLFVLLSEKPCLLRERRGMRIRYINRPQMIYVFSIQRDLIRPEGFTYMTTVGYNGEFNRFQQCAVLSHV